MDIGGFSSRVKRPEREDDHLPASSAKVMNVQSNNSASSCAFVTWCLIKHRDNFNFPLTFWINKFLIVKLFRVSLRYKKAPTKWDAMPASWYYWASFQKIDVRFEFRVKYGFHHTDANKTIFRRQISVKEVPALPQSDMKRHMKGYDSSLCSLYVFRARNA
jgi:hypothetical protein